MSLEPPMSSNVIPLFGRHHPVYLEQPRNQARTHFLNTDGLTMADHGGYVWDDVSTLCGREASGYIDKDNAYPECEACVEEHARRTGWTFPLPEVVSTD